MEKRLVIEGIKMKAIEFKDLNLELRSDREVVLTAVKKKIGNLEFASNEIRDNKGVMLDLFKFKKGTFKYATHRLKADKEFVLEIIREEGRFIKEVSKELQGDRDIVLESIKTFKLSKKLVNDILQSLGKDEEVVMELSETIDIPTNVLLNFRSNKKLAIELLRRNDGCLQELSEDLRADREVIFEAIKYDGDQMQYAAEEIKRDREVAVEIIKNMEEFSYDSIGYLSMSLRNDKKLMLEAIQKNPWVLCHVGNKLERDEDLIIEALEQEDVIECLPPDMYGLQGKGDTFYIRNSNNKGKGGSITAYWVAINNHGTGYYIAYVDNLTGRYDMSGVYSNYEYAWEDLTFGEVYVDNLFASLNKGEQEKVIKERAKRYLKRVKEKKE